MSLPEDLALAERAPGGVRDSASPKGMRRDTRRNRRRLLAAASDLVKEGAELSMLNIAERADIALATAYRHFPSPELLIAEYVIAVLDDLAGYGEHLTSTGRQRFSDLLSRWIELIEAHGHVMVNFRSRRGFLQRLHDEDPAIRTVASAWREPIAQFLAASELPDLAGPHALFLCNQIFDPRDVLDQLRFEDVDAQALQQSLVATFEGALRGWLSAQPCAAPTS